MNKFLVVPVDKNELGIETEYWNNATVIDTELDAMERAAKEGYGWASYVVVEVEIKGKFRVVVDKKYTKEPVL